MGMRLEYSCPACGHKTASSKPGEKDRGFFSEMEPMKCHDCQIIVQVITGKSRDMGGEIKEHVECECPECKGKKVAAWDGACPKCGEHMKSGKLIIEWD